MMDKKEMARFEIRITSVENASWQGEVVTETDRYQFQSEMQLLTWLHSQFPEIFPDQDE
ncbi:MAG: hypothetical protein II983_04895 [Firmicutes bacterium]|nr:hypothetical protein [Bacillota bacterium]